MAIRKQLIMGHLRNHVKLPGGVLEEIEEQVAFHLDKSEIENNLLKSALDKAQEKLKIFRKDTGNIYKGGMEYVMLMNWIDKLLGKV